MWWLNVRRGIPSPGTTPAHRVGSHAPPEPDDGEPDDGERGAVMVFVAVSMVALLALTAFTFDFGRMYMERRQLQSGADAAAMAVATQCAAGDCGSYVATADLYADANANDGAGLVRGVTVDPGGQTVSVDVATEEPDGGNVFAMVFAPVVGFDGLTVGAQATVAWGSPSGLTSVPLVFSQCEWQNLSPSAVSVASLPPITAGYGAAGSPHLISFHGKDECHESSSGSDLPGGFGWVDANSSCETTSSVGGWVTVDPGNSPSKGCKPNDLRPLLGTVVLIPYFDELTGTGNNAKYHIEGYGAIHLTGYYLGGGQWRQKSIVSGNYPCSGSRRCLEGYILSDYVSPDDSADIGGVDRGLTIVKFVG